MKLKQKEKARKLRECGFSMKEISDNLDVSKSTVSLWVRDINLNKKAIQRLHERCEMGRRKSLQIQRQKIDNLLSEIIKSNCAVLNHMKEDKSLCKIFCSLLYWCEGSKSGSSVRFINSDPIMVSTFLSLLRASFAINETKLRVCLHLHNYHDNKLQKKFWSDITKIPLNQFLKIYRKPNTGKRQRKNYQGCASVRYHDHKIAKELNNLWQLFGEKYKK